VKLKKRKAGTRSRRRRCWIRCRRAPYPLLWEAPGTEEVERINDSEAKMSGCRAPDLRHEGWRLGPHPEDDSEDKEARRGFREVLRGGPWHRGCAKERRAGMRCEADTGKRREWSDMCVPTGALPKGCGP